MPPASGAQYAPARAAATAGDESVFGSFDLVRGLAADLADAFEDVVDAMDVGLAEEAAMGVHRDRAAELDVAGLHEVDALAGFAEAVAEPSPSS